MLLLGRGAKQAALMTKVPGLARPPDMTPEIRAQEARDRRQAAGVQVGDGLDQQLGQRGDQRG